VGVRFYYDPLIPEWKPTLTLETVTTVGSSNNTFIKLYKGTRDIVTVAWSANSNIYVKGKAGHPYIGNRKNKK